MFAGHYAPALALKAGYREIPLWKLFIAVQAVDVLFFTLAPLGIERMAIVPSRPSLLAMDLQFMPYSHSLVATALWGVLVAGAGRTRENAVLGVAVASHWFMDLLVHTPDLPIAAGDGPKVGLGLWTWPLLACGVEVALVVAGFALYFQRERRGLVLVAMLVLCQVATALVLPAPPSVLALAVASQVAYVGFAAGAAYLDRRPVGSVW